VLPVTLRTERLVLDAPNLEDHELVAQYCTDPLFERFLTIPWPYTAGDAEQFLATFVPAGWDKDREFTWAIRESAGGPLLGVIGHRVALGDVGYWLGGPHRGNGFMTEAVGAVCDWLFDRGLDAVNWECIVGNSASASVARKSGFAFSGIAPATAAYRDGSHPQSWHGVLDARDSRGQKPGWPA